MRPSTPARRKERVEKGECEACESGSALEEEEARTPVAGSRLQEENVRYGIGT